MLQGATMQQLQQVQVQSQGTPITVNTHAHVRLYVHQTHTHRPVLVSAALWVTAAYILCSFQAAEVCRGDCSMRSGGLC